MASSGGGFRATNEIPQLEMKIVEPAPEEPGRVGSKRVRDSLNDVGSQGFYGVTTEENPAIANHVHMNSDGTSQIGGRFLHGTRREWTLPDSCTSRSSISSPGENLGNKTKGPTKTCTFNNQGQCNKGNSGIFLHEIEGPGSDFRWNNEENAGFLAADAYGNSRGSEEGSHFKDSDGLTEEKLCRSLIHAYGETDKSMHGSDKQSTFTRGVSLEMSNTFEKLTTPINELVPSPVAYEKEQELSMGHHSGRGTFPRLVDRGIFQAAADKGTYLDMNYPDLKLRYRSFDLSIPSDPLQRNEKLLAYGGRAKNLPNVYHKENLSSHAPYSSYSLPDFRKPLYATSDHSFGNPTSHLGTLSQHLAPPLVEKVGPHKYVDIGTGTSRPALVATSSSQPSIVSPEFSPIKDEVWVTSVPFVPSFDFPATQTPPSKQYDPFVDYIDSPKDDNKNNLKSSSISRQHTNPYVVTPKSLNHDEKLATNMSAKGSDEPACWIASDRGRSSSLDDNKRVKVDIRKPDAACYSKKMRNFRFRLADHVKELIAPDWKEGYLSKDAHKLIVKKSIDKVLCSIDPHQVPTSEEAITNYITISKSKIESLVKAYVDKHRTT